MKKLIVSLIFIVLTAAVMAQGSFNGFFKPVKFNEKLVKQVNSTVAPASVWLFRPAVEVSAIQLNWNKDIKGFDASAFQSGGLGLGYQHYIWNEGVPYNNWGANLLFLFPLKVQESVPADLSLAATVTAFRVVNVGVGYNITQKVPFILTAITYNF